MPKKQDTKAIDRWQAENVDKILIKPRKDQRLPERLQIAVDKTNAKSRQAYIIDAIILKLASDGIPQLPPQND